MDYTEIIKKASYLKYPFDGIVLIGETLDKRKVWIDGVTSPLAKQITEIEKLEFAIKVLSEHTAASHYITSDITELEHLRDKFINELKLK